MTRRATLRDIAKAAGVSAVTVHKVIYDKRGVAKETREKVLAIAKSMDYSVNEAASSLKRKAVHIVVVLQSINDPRDQNFFFRKMWNGIDRAEADLRDYGARITRMECRNDWESQEEILCNLGRRKDVDGVILHCWDETRLNPAIDDLFEKGVPTVTVNSDAIDSRRVGYVGAPNERIGKLAAELMGRFIPPGGRVVLAGGSKMVENLKANRGGFHSFLKSASPRTTVAEVYSQGDKERFKEEFAQALEGGRVDGVYAITSRDTFNACTVIQEMGLSGKIRVIGSDAFTELGAFFDDETLHATVWKDELAQAERAVQLLYQHLSERPMTVEPIRIGVVMRNNLEDYI